MWSLIVINLLAINAPAHTIMPFHTEEDCVEFLDGVQSSVRYNQRHWRMVCARRS